MRPNARLFARPICAPSAARMEAWILRTPPHLPLRRVAQRAAMACGRAGVVPIPPGARVMNLRPPPDEEEEAAEAGAAPSVPLEAQSFGDRAGCGAVSIPSLRRRRLVIRVVLSRIDRGAAAAVRMPIRAPPAHI